MLHTTTTATTTFVDDKLFGLGSNDAGGALVSLLASFVYFYERNDLKYNLIYENN